MNPINDQTLRQIFIEDRLSVALNDEVNYKRKYKSSNRYNIITGKDNIHFLSYYVDSIDYADQTEHRIFRSASINDGMLDNNPTIILYKFLGESARYVKNLVKEAIEIYTEWYGENVDHCDHCGKSKTLITSGIYSHFCYLCDRCSNDLYNQDVMKESKMYDIFPNLETKMNRQKIFDTIVAHARRQQSRATEFGECRYRTTDNKKCFIGALIPDDKYQSDFEGSNINLSYIQIVAFGEVLRYADKLFV